MPPLAGPHGPPSSDDDQGPPPLVDSTDSECDRKRAKTPPKWVPRKNPKKNPRENPRKRTNLLTLAIQVAMWLAIWLAISPSGHPASCTPSQKTNKKLTNSYHSDHPPGTASTWTSPRPTTARWPRESAPKKRTAALRAWCFRWAARCSCAARFVRPLGLPGAALGHARRGRGAPLALPWRPPCAALGPAWCCCGGARLVLLGPALCGCGACSLAAVGLAWRGPHGRRRPLLPF
jgi:hypothetical protein